MSYSSQKRDAALTPRAWAMTAADIVAITVCAAALLIAVVGAERFDIEKLKISAETVYRMHVNEATPSQPVAINHD
ncbi:MAG: hypothetical protein AAF493_04940 [Pseudomonadota bacterium]